MFGMFYYTSKSTRIAITYFFALILFLIVYGILLFFSINIFKIWWLLIIVFLVSRYIGRYTYFLFFGVHCTKLEFKNETDFELLVQYYKEQYLVSGEYFGEPIGKFKLRAAIFQNIEANKYFKRLFINSLILHDTNPKPLELKFKIIEEEVSISFNKFLKI